MKKWIALLCVCVGGAAMAVTSMQGPQYLAYDFKASIRRLDLVPGIIKYSLNTFDGTVNATIDCTSYQVANDTLKGFLFIPLCIECTRSEQYPGANQSTPFGWYDNLDKRSDDFSVLYVARGGDKSYSVWKSYGDVDAGLFNKGVGTRPFDEGDILSWEWDPQYPPNSTDGYMIDTYAPTSLKKLKGAWMDFSFDFGDCYAEQIGDFTWGNLGAWPYGFLGHGSEYTYLEGTGFGAAAQLTQSAFCRPTTKCFTVSSINGHMIGWSYHKEVCRQPPIWDVCTLKQIDEGVVDGTWSVRLNTKISTQMINFDVLEISDSAEEAALVLPLFGVKYQTLILDCYNTSK